MLGHGVFQVFLCFTEKNQNIKLNKNPGLQPHANEGHAQGV